MSKVVIFGTGEFAQVAAVTLEQDSPHEVVAFTVDKEHHRESSLLGKPIVPFEHLLREYPPEKVELFVAVGFSGLNEIRTALCRRCEAAGYKLISYVSSRATQWGQVRVGRNCFVFENNVLQPFVSLGDNSILWSGNHIGHHVQIGENCFITSHVVISGGTVIGDNCFIGVNATIGDHITIGSDCVIGAGALVLKNTEPGGAYLVSPTERARVPAYRLGAFRRDRQAG